MSMGSQKCSGLPQPIAGIAVALPGVIRYFPVVPSQVGHGCFQGIKKIREWGVEHWLTPIQPQPATSLAKLAVRAARIPGVKAPLQMAAAKVDLAFYAPAGIFEQHCDITGNRPRLSSTQRIHAYFPP
jgi:hypothetical protein